MAARGLVNGRGPLRRSGRDLVSDNRVFRFLIYTSVLKLSIERKADIIT